ncbi:hypothetical protein Cgig2_025248 [Carnegiea gigantea]|uniref:Retrovirus-related Pol polyprotein from transposon TNT 1-94-like beta-barrel domain-containing protein n=1 Tax=Carnegiea gigantea TaxID=171969 RepID=A0A9Q1JNC5_9CARY|nr:hypothetical protein Cgig2_025248 [Carnegiea gigantea]
MCCLAVPALNMCIRAFEHFHQDATGTYCPSIPAQFVGGFRNALFICWPIHRFPTVLSERKLQEKIRGKAKLEDEDDSYAYVIDGGDVFLAKSAQESVDDSIKGQNSWVLDSAASIHICKDKNSFDTLHSHGNYGYITVDNNEKLKVEGVGSVHLKLHNDVVRTFHNVKHVPSASVSLISLGKLTSYGYKYVGVRTWCKMYKVMALNGDGPERESAAATASLYRKRTTGGGAASGASVTML